MWEGERCRRGVEGYDLNLNFVGEVRSWSPCPLVSRHLLPALSLLSVGGGSWGLVGTGWREKVYIGSSGNSVKLHSRPQSKTTRTKGEKTK